MIKQIAFLLLVFLILGTGANAAVPTVNSFIISEAGRTYVNEDKPELLILATDANGMAFSCNNTIFTSPYVAYATSYTDFNFLDVSYGCNTTEGSKTIYIKVESPDGNYDTDSNSIIYDVTKPAYVSGIYLSNTEIELTFSEELAGTLAAGEFIIGDGNIVTVAAIQTDKTKVKLTVPGDPSTATTVDYTGNNLIDLAGNALVNLVNAPVSANAAPVASSVNISPSSPKTSDTLTCNYTYSDAESNAEGITTFLWFRNSAPQASQTSKTLASSQTSVGDSWICQVRPIASTGTITGADVNSGAVTVANIATPVISSSTHEEDTWKASDDPAFSWTEVSGATNYYYVFDTVSDTIPGTSSNTRSSTSITFDNQSNGTHYFHVRANVGGELSGTDDYTIRIDDSKPGVPTDLSASYDSDDEEVYLDWVSGSDSGGSGIDYYKIYRGTVSDFGDMTKIGQTTGSGTEYSSYSSLTEGKRYYYSVIAVDAAGNESVESDYASVVYGADAPKPAVELVSPLDGEVVDGIFEIKASATADSSTSIKEVRFYVDESLIGKGTKSGSYYVFDWNTLEEDDGTYELKATAIDRYDVSSNPDSIDITIENADTQEEEKVAAQTAIDSAEGSKESADALVAELASLGLCLARRQAG